ncbi:tetratricopeptide repeat protein [Thiohalomonas denitrificans]|uniref:Sel1 repeat-containing protein n=1 Tax=Thiohalomonas denitrificans TaxID=415747 RepID=A0A1G5PQA5_9GAMM|nr:tetratricopeptide repeat protein [Thiohalomonas denitrificans]SCZ51754.1 Sel1 repeat-containing protein [Thiohalomonas denitrificans]
MSTSQNLQTILEGFKKDQLPDIEARAEKGDAQAQFTLGVLYANGRGVKPNPGKAVEWLSSAAKQDIGEAMTLLGWMYANGHGVASSASKARKYFQEAARRGDSDAKCSLAELLIEGAHPGTPAVSEALGLYENAANQGHPKAQYMLGKLLSEGNLVAEDTEAAFQWLTLAVMNGSEPAQRELQMLTARLDQAEVEAYKKSMMERMKASH